MKPSLFIVLISAALSISACTAPVDTEALSSSLTPQEKESLTAALMDEYKAEATYEQVLKDFGNARPFSNIINAEQRHSDAIIRLMEKYNMQIPENLWTGKASSYESLKDACEAGVEAEIANADLYDDLLNTTEREDIQRVFQNNQAASLNNHLTAFERCAKR